MKSLLHLSRLFFDVVDGKKLTYSWRYDGYPGNSFVTFELFGEGQKTRLKLTHEGIETLGPGTRISQKKISQSDGQVF